MPGISQESLSKLTRLKNEISSGDLEFSPEELFKRLSVQLPNYYIYARDNSLSESLLSEDSRRNLLDTFFMRYPLPEDFDNILFSIPSEGESSTLDRIREFQALLEPLNENKLPPAMTICVPIAVLGESSETITRVMQQIEKSAQSLDGSVRVVLWANAKISDNTHTEVENAAHHRYTELKETVKPFCSEKIQVTTALEMLPNSSFSMSELRSHYMEALVGETIQGIIPIDHPVLWLDADTTFLSENSLSSIKQDLTTQPLGFCHPDVDYSLEWTEGIQAQKMDDASKLLLIDEMARRASKRTSIQNHQPIDERNYPEESGMSFTMASYLIAGGVDTQDRVNETVRLAGRYDQFFFGDVESFSRLPEQLVKLFTRGETTKTFINKPVVRWLNHAKIRLSARRIHEGIKSHGVKSLIHRTASLDDSYVLYNELGSNIHASDTVDTHYAKEVLSRNRDRAGTKVGRKVVDRMLSNKNLGL